MFALVTPPAPAPTAFPGPERAPEVRSAPERVDEGTREQRQRERWLLSLEGVVHAPSDIGVRAGLEFPFRLRVSTSFGFMPAEWITALVAKTTNDPRANLVLDLPKYRGTVWRMQVGYRPFRKLGLYFDAGYAHASIHGSVDLPPEVLGQELDVEGSYGVDTTLNIWLLEAGYQWQFANRAVLALGLGLMSTFDADTRVAVSRGASDAEEFVEGARLANDALERYGTLPFFTLRAGVDFL